MLHQRLNFPLSERANYLKASFGGSKFPSRMHAKEERGVAFLRDRQRACLAASQSRMKRQGSQSCDCCTSLHHHDELQRCYWFEPSLLQCARSEERRVGKECRSR